MALGLVLGSLAVGGHANAEEAKVRLRIASAAPEGTSWANVLRKFEHEVTKETGGKVAVKLYLGGVAGNEQEVYDLMQAGKLDAAVSGGPICTRIVPSMRVLDVIGLFQDQEEATFVSRELRPTLDREAHDAGYTLLATGSIGSVIMFSREPITSMAELRKSNLWVWDMKEDEIKQAAVLKIPVVPVNLPDAQKAYDTKRTDGFLTTPMTALAFQWYVGTKYITDLRTGYIMGCFIVREKAIDKLSPEHQAVLRKAAARVGTKIDADNLRIDKKLLGGTFEKLGLKLVPVSKKFRAEFFEASRLMRQQMGEKLVPRDLLDRVTQLLADYRAEHH
jgi:TRAP-type C4-dicarboxylate transport system substrate-binding protein